MKGNPIWHAFFSCIDHFQPKVAKSVKGNPLDRMESSSRKEAVCTYFINLRVSKIPIVEIIIGKDSILKLVTNFLPTNLEA